MNKIIILAAGKGTRMGSDLPKALVSLKGRPMIEYLLDSVVASGIDSEPVLVVSPDNQSIIKDALRNYNLQYAIQTEQLGTGHAVACARAQIGSEVDNIIVLYCDHPFISAVSIKKLAAEKQHVVSLMPTRLEDFGDWRQNFYHWGRIVRGADNKIQKISEFKDATELERAITEVNPGIMRFNRTWLWENVDQLTNSNVQKEYYLTDMVKLAFEQNKEVGGLLIEPLEAMGINSQEELKIAESLIK
jgi:bifunctional UDP-N-acetylglucosamine pyrophosphorylase / glucosamine-1-phosphate N-acetyltransferase